MTIAFCTIALTRFGTEEEVLGAIVLIPIFRLVNLGVPVVIEATLLWLPLIYGPFIPGLLWYVRSSPVDIAWLRRPVVFALYLPIVVALSGLLASVEFEIIAPESLIPVWHLQNLLVLSVVMFVFVSVVEELIFRGLVQGTLVDRFGSVAGIVIASLLFGATHAGYSSGLEIGFAFGVGLFFGVVYQRSKSLVLVIIAHGLLNVLVFGVFPLLGPALTFDLTQLLSRTVG